jgi:predicted RNA-binding Zn ribbon-like protein
MNVASATWRLVGGDLSLDFANTLGGRTDEAGSDPRERIVNEGLVTYRHLLDWARIAGVVESGRFRLLAKQAAAQPALASVTLRRAIALREAIYRTARALIAQKTPSQTDLDTIRRQYRDAKMRQTLVYREGALKEQWLNTERSLECILWPVSVAAMRLFVEVPSNRIKVCPGQGCQWLFLDHTKNRSRRWCSMALCGNLSKIRAYRLRGFSLYHR